MAIGNHKDLGKKAVDAIGEIAGAFNPLGGGNVFTADGALRTAAPTVVDPVIELAFNKNFAGNAIEKEPFGGQKDNRPGLVRARESTQRSTTGQAYLALSKALNALGGSPYEAGPVSPTPEPGSSERVSPAGKFRQRCWKGTHCRGCGAGQKYTPHP